jgi:glyoxylase-like metal-dependent hydrolase (beta-lactamase superfamily II)
MATVVKDNNIQIDRLELGPFGTNSYILICQKTNESVLVDAPGEAGIVLERFKDTPPKYILMTHNHFDHVGALNELKAALNISIAAHLADRDNLPVEVDLLLNHGDKITFGAIELQVLHTPGHTPGSVCFLVGNYLIAGDTLFPGGPGKTQSPADFQRIIESITHRLFILPDETKVFPGHGEATTIKESKQQYQVFSARPQDPNLCGDVVWTEAQGA